MNSYRFGNSLQKSLGSINIRVPVLESMLISIQVDVVPSNVPFLIGLDILDRYQMIVDNVHNVLRCYSIECEIPLVRKFGHIYLEWPKQNDVFYTQEELRKLHRNFSHPSADKLYSLLKMARPWETDEGTRRILEEISSRCEACQRFSQAPVRFKVTLPSEENLVFGDELSIDIMFLEGKAVLHIVDTATRFSAATFLDAHGVTYGQSVNGIWLAFVMTWCLVYTGYPNRLRTDQGSAFTSDRWRQLADTNGVKLRLSGIEAHSSLGIGERYHEPLRRIYRKIRYTHPTVSPLYLLKVAVKAMNDTMGENGLVPSRLVFGMIPRFPIINTDLPTQKERMEALKTAQAEMNSIVAERRVVEALTRNIPPAADRVYKLGEEVLVYSEAKREWVGPFEVVHVHGRMITVKNKENSVRKTFNSFQIKPFYHEISSNIHFFKSQNDKMDHEINVTEVIQSHDPRSAYFKDAIQKEIGGLEKRNTWKVVPKATLPPDANILGGRFVLAIKNGGTSQETWKARFVVQGHKDSMKKSLVHCVSLAKQFSTKIILSIAATMDFKLFTTDVTQAYLQSMELLNRKVFVQPCSAFPLSPDMVLQLQKPLYGLPESGDYWDRTMKNHIKKDIGMQACTLDDAFYYKRKSGNLIGLCATYVDDSLHVGTEEYCKLCEETEKRFSCKSREWNNVQFAGIQIEKTEDDFIAHQISYITKLAPLSYKSRFADFRSLRAQLAWATNTRPDICYTTAVLAQATEEAFDNAKAEYIKRINSVVSNLKKLPDLVLRYPKLELSSLKLQVYSDASYATNKDKTSQLGYFIFLMDKHHRCHPIYWVSYKSKRSTRSVLGSEVMAFADAFDMAYTLKFDLQKILGKELPLRMLTDNKSLFDVLTKATSTTEKRLMIDIQTVRDAYRSFEVNDVALVRSEFNIADALTKCKSQSIMIDTIRNGRLDHPIQQWIIRSKNEHGLG